MSKIVADFLSERGYPELKIKGVFFDMDGVLFDSMPYHASALVRVMNECGVSFTSTDAYRNEGRTGASTINGFFLKSFGREATGDEISEMYAKKSAYFNEMNKVIRMKDVDLFIEELKRDGTSLFVVTGSGQKSLIDVLDTYFPNSFSEGKMVTAYDVKYGKPDPEPYLMALEKSGLQPWEVMVIENAPLGVRSAVAAGLFTIAVNTGVLDSNELAEEGAPVVLPDMSSLLEYYNRYLRK